MSLQLVHSARRAEEPDSATEPELSLIQGGRDPVAEDAAMVAALRKAHEEKLAQLQANEDAAQQAHERRMAQLDAEEAEKQRLHEKRMKALDDAHRARMRRLWFGFGSILIAFAVCFVLAICKLPTIYAVPFWLAIGLIYSRMVHS